MSKKMLKRSLALGALMAFVITGQAWAASGSLNGEIQDGAISGSGTLKAVVGSDNTPALQTGNSSGTLTESVTINGFSAMVLDGSNNVHSNAFNAYKNTTLNIVTGDVSTAETANLINTTVFHAQGGTLNVTAGDISLENVGNGFMSQNSGQLIVEANDITVNANSGNALQSSYYKEDASITINADNLSLVSTTAAGISSMGGDVVADVAEDIYIEGSNGVNANYGGSVMLEAQNITVTNNGSYNAVRAANGGNVSINGTNNIIVNGNVYAEGNNSEISINGGSSSTINGTVKTEKSNTINLGGKVINIDAKGGRGVNAVTSYYAPGAYSIINLGDKDTSEVNIKNATYGILSQYNGSKIDITTDKLNITDTSYGIWAMNASYTNHPDGTDDGNLEDDSRIIIGSNTDTKIITDGVAIIAQSSGNIKIDGNLYAEGTEGVIDVRGEAVVNINKANDKTKVVQLVGDIIYDYTDHIVDSTVNINLANNESYFVGNIINTAPVTSGKDGIVTRMSIALADGATWELSEASIVNNATFGENSNLVLKGDGTQFTKTGDYALNGVGTADVLKVDGKANIKVEGIDYKTYNVATGFETVEATKTYWNVSNLNNLMQGEWVGNAKDGLQLNVVAKEVGQIADDMGVDSGTANALGSIIAAANSNTAPDTPEAQNVKDFANALANAPADVAADAANAVIKMAEAGGNNATAANIVKNVTGVTNDRLSFNCGHSAPHKGGHGVGLFEEGSGADIWVEYVHGKDEVEDMPSTAGATSYEGQYNGFVMGVDFKKVNKFQSGVAFNYGEGDTNSVGTSSRTHSDYDFWGVGYYGNIHNDDSNIIFDINYAKSDSDVKNTSLGINYEASPETTTWTAGVKVEKLYQNDNVQIVPYTGLRYMSIDSDDYATKCGTYKYSMDRQDIWLLPVGVSIRQEVTNDNGWTVSPRVDLSYIWAFGDTDSNMEFATALNTKTNIGYDVMDDGSFLGLVGIEAHKGQWGYGVSYSYQKGDYSTSKKWFVDVNYSF